VRRRLLGLVVAQPRARLFRGLNRLKSGPLVQPQALHFYAPYSCLLQNLHSRAV